MERRSLVKLAIFSIITLGIYQIFWLYFTNKEMREKDQDVAPFKLLFAPLLLMLGLGILQVITLVIMDGDSSTALNILTIIGGILAIVAALPIMLYWFYKYCKAAEGATEGELSFGLSYAMVIVLAFVNLSILWPFLVQYYFNKLSEEPIEVPVPKLS
ncbi:MAG TPA: DUF4234 domain-containing protein [Candidatus Saccharimonadales bacterium]